MKNWPHGVTGTRNVRALAEELAGFAAGLAGGPRRTIAAALLAAARGETQPKPRVWLPGDTVPAGVAVVDEPGAADGEYWVATDMPARYDRPVVEIRAPDVAAVAAAVAAEKARRAEVGRG